VQLAALHVSPNTRLALSLALRLRLGDVASRGTVELVHACTVGIWPKANFRRVTRGPMLMYGQGVGWWREQCGSVISLFAHVALR
jgi:hypothetical protein